MKLSAKAISSPARTDKFPPPLMRFLRSNAGSRSRRSRSSPMFVLRNNNNNNKNNTINESTQEPSSPKVTCMGQVRAKRSSKSKQAAVNRDRAPTTRCSCRCSCCCWIRKPIPCNCRPIWPKWTFFRRKWKPTKLKEDFDSVKSEPNFPVKSLYEDEEDNIDNNNSSNDGSGFASASISNSCCTPPRNALLLTRCRSAPYRSSSLASKFWGSPSEETEPPSLQRHSISGGEEEEEAKMDPLKKLGFLEDSLRERIAASINNSEKNVEGTLLKLKGVLDSVEAARPVPVVLTRCKSEPARTGHRLIDPHEVNNNNYLWKKRRLGFDVDNNHCSPLHMLSD